LGEDNNLIIQTINQYFPLIKDEISKGNKEALTLFHESVNKDEYFDYVFST
jgi:hypothetical protein